MSRWITKKAVANHRKAMRNRWLKELVDGALMRHVVADIALTFSQEPLLRHANVGKGKGVPIVFRPGGGTKGIGNAIPEFGDTE